MGGGTVGRDVPTLRARPGGVCVHVCMSGSWCVLAGRVLAAPPSDTTTVGPLWISFAPPALPLHNLLSLLLLSSGEEVWVPSSHFSPPSLFLIAPFFLSILPHCLSISFSISEPDSVYIKATD